MHNIFEKLRMLILDDGGFEYLKGLCEHFFQSTYLKNLQDLGWILRSHSWFEAKHFNKFLRNLEKWGFLKHPKKCPNCRPDGLFRDFWIIQVLLCSRIQARAPMKLSPRKMRACGDQNSKLIKITMARGICKLNRKTLTFANFHFSTFLKLFLLGFCF